MENKRFLVLVSMALLSQVTVRGSSMCPQQCKCRWKDGKKTVECQRGALGALPDSIEADTQVLDLSYNILQRLPARAFVDAGLVHLQKLLMRGCGLLQVDAEAFVQLTNLVTLDLSENKLRVLPDAALRHTVALRELDLHENLISHVPAKLPAELTRLDLSYCRIDSINIGAFKDLKQLQHLRLDHNRIAMFPTNLVLSLRSLQGVELHGNPWICDCRLRALHRWLREVAHPTSPLCKFPSRLEGKKFSDIDLDSFACPPQVLVTGKKAQGKAGSNITAWCPVAGLPTPAVSWFLGDVLIHNGSKVGSATVYIINEIYEEKGSLLLLAGPVMKDSGSTLRCVATNAAGAATASFTLTVDFSPNLSKEQILGLTVSLILGIIISLCVCIFLVKRRNKQQEKINGTLQLSFPNGGGSVVAARTPDEQNDEYESDEADEQELEYTMTRLPPSRTGSLVTTLIDTGGDENEELLHRQPQRPLTGVWPAQALALLDSAAPEHVMYPTTRAPRHSLLPDFAPDYTNSWSCHFSTLPRTQRQDPSLYGRSYTPEEAPLCPSFMNSITIPEPCPPPPPLSPSIC
ncbi:Leucine-rich repeat, partial [Trinorchestia longiramus]